MTLVCHLWPAISPHGREVPTSVWNLPYCVWRGFALAADAYAAARKKEASQ